MPHSGRAISRTMPQVRWFINRFSHRTAQRVTCDTRVLHAHAAATSPLRGADPAAAAGSARRRGGPRSAARLARRRPAHRVAALQSLRLCDPDARPAAARPRVRRRASLVVSMIAHRAVNHATMLLAFLSVLDAVLGSVDDLRPIVLHWLPAQRVMPFSTYRLLRMELGPCGPAINVRIAQVGDSDTVADTVGLADLGLPDLQTRATGRDPAALAFRLVNLARSMFVGDKLDCVWVEEASFSPPRRDALTIQLD